MKDRRWVLVVLVAVVVGVLVAATLRKGEARAIKMGWPMDMAHRGASIAAPENTMEAFRLAVEGGAGGLELDVHLTRDGELVVIHDDTADRTTDGSGLVREMSLEELRRLDAGYRFTPDAGRTYPFRGRGLVVMTLEEVYRAFPGTRINVEMKEDQPGIQEEVLRTIREAGAQDRTIVASGRHGVIQRFRELAGGEVPTSASVREIEIFFVLSRLRLEGLVQPSYNALQVPVDHRGITVVTPRFVSTAHERGVRVDVWTINDAEEMGRLLDMGVDTVITDRPTVLREVLEERKAP